MTQKKTLKLFLLTLIICDIFLSQISIVQAATTQQTPQYTGVQASIEKYLCTPTNAKVPINGYNTSEENKNNVAAAGNAAQNDLYLCINKLYRFAIVLASTFAVFMIVIAGYIYMSADGNEESVTKAKGLLVSSIASLVILFVGYILLRALNPDLIQFQNIQPPTVVYDSGDKMQAPSINNVNTVVNSQGQVTSVAGGAGKTAGELQANGCNFQGGVTGSVASEVPKMTQALFDKIKNICYNVKTYHSISPQISSVIGIGKHATNSYHYRGCAIDFADGGGPGFFNIIKKTGRPAGIEIYDEAKAQGFSDDRIQPGTDRGPASKFDHIHLDLGSSCPSSNATGANDEDNDN